VIDGRRFIQVGIRGPIRPRRTSSFTASTGSRCSTSTQVKARGVAAVVDEIRRVATGPAYDVRHRCGGSAFAPGTGTPEVGGLTSHEAQQLVRGLAGVALVGGDIVEVAPPFDRSGPDAALLAADLMFSSCASWLAAVIRRSG
jgi:guanidinopropionase